MGSVDRHYAIDRAWHVAIHAVCPGSTRLVACVLRYLAFEVLMAAQTWGVAGLGRLAGQHASGVAAVHAVATHTGQFWILGALGCGLPLIFVGGQPRCAITPKTV